MRKYTSKSDKVELYSQKYNLPKEEVRRILTEHEALLTLDELKIKYDCLDIGKLPDWLSEEDLDKVIRDSVNSHFNHNYSFWTTREELHSYMQEFIRKKIHLFNSKAHIASAISNRMVWLLRQHLGRGSYTPISLDDTVPGTSNSSKVVTYNDVLTRRDTEKDNRDFLETLDSISDKTVKTLLTVVGYLMCNISCLEERYQQIVDSSEDDIKLAIQQLEKSTEHNDMVNQMKLDGVVVEERKKVIKVQDIIKAMKLNLTETTFLKKDKETNTYIENTKIEKESPTKLLNDVREYLVNIGFANTKLMESTSRKDKGSRIDTAILDNPNYIDTNLLDENITYTRQLSLDVL